jgi:hypothetical protein
MVSNIVYGRRALCDFIRNGAVAQLGERQNRTLEVGGSTPLCSTIKMKRINSPGLILFFLQNLIVD